MREFELYYSSKAERTALLTEPGVVNYCEYDTHDVLFAVLQVFRRYSGDNLRILDVEDGSDTAILLLVNSDFDIEKNVEKCKK